MPRDNFVEYWSARFAAQGKADAAKEYADTSLVKSEIYVKGVRNPYSLAVDSYRGWLTWGEFLAAAGKKEPAAPVNNSKWNTGPKQLPPATPALHANDKHGGITGPIYYFDGDSPSPNKFPPHFNQAGSTRPWTSSSVLTGHCTC